MEEKTLKQRSSNNTKIAFCILIFNIVYIAVSAFFAVLSSLLEIPCNRDGLYTFTFLIFIVLLILYPFVCASIHIASIIFNVFALRSGESKIKNITMLCASVIYTITVMVLLAQFWQGAMGVWFLGCIFTAFLFSLKKTAQNLTLIFVILDFLIFFTFI